MLSIFSNMQPQGVQTMVLYSPIDWESFNQADLNILLDSSDEYMIGRKEAETIIEEVKSGVRQWKYIANRLGITKREMAVYEQVYQRALK